jgi:transposase-like protein
MQSCAIEQVGKARNGKPRFWCRTHGASATGRYGTKLSTCERATEGEVQSDCLELDAGAYSGGVALWGAVSPVYDTSGRPPDAGIHVHARRDESGEKEIDGTFSAVSLIHRLDLLDERRIRITAESAVQYYISRFLERKIKYLFCTYCGAIHLDADYFAVNPHRRHLCHDCGKYFQDSERGISNPIMLLRQQLADLETARVFKRSERCLDIDQADYPGGLQVWASNPAIVWTAERPEEEGIHVHLYTDLDGEPETDETFGKVIIDGVELNENFVRHLMAQQALLYLKNKVVSLRCPRCEGDHFDRQELAFRPHKRHTCEHCGFEFDTPGRRRLVVSNPLVDILDRLQLRAASIS